MRTICLITASNTNTPKLKGFFFQVVKFLAHLFRPSSAEADQDDETRAEQCRSNAKEYSDKRHALFQQSRNAYNSGDKKQAKELSDQAKEYGTQMNVANRKASELLLKFKNQGRELGELDLHGQFVQEAIHLTESRIQECKKAKLSQLVIIVGRGLHSENGNAKIKPAITQLLEREQISAEFNSPNEGCITIFISKSRGIFNVNQCPIQ